MISSSQNNAHSSLPLERLERLGGWGGAVASEGYVYRPSTKEQIEIVFALARDTGRTVTLRGAGRSYGDASIGSESIVLDLSRMNRILSWNPESGRIVAEPGVTIEQLWKYAIEDGWWPPVVPGTMFPTLGGCLGMNIHGKNNFNAGPIGDHVHRFRFLTPEGEEMDVSRNTDDELFHSVIGSFGMLGCFTEIELQMKKVYSGLLEVEVLVAKNLGELFQIFYQRLPQSDYLVGWIDAFASEEKLGRAVIHQANYLAQGVDPVSAQTLKVSNQELPDSILGILPKSVMWRFMKPLVNDAGVMLINWAKYMSSVVGPKGKKFRQSHAGFAFLLDYIPNWKKSYGKGGLIQYQSFVPEETAEGAFREQLTLCQQSDLVPYLAVFKRHKQDDFLLRHSVDGFSLALDFRITDRNKKAVVKLANKLNEIVLKSGGRFYFAKDATLTPEAARKYLGEQTLQKYFALKERFDPKNILQSDLSRRVIEPLRTPSTES